MEDIKVSVIVPNFNHSKFLKQRLESVFNQTYQNFEVILLDDCSTDDSVNVLKEYSNHPKVSHFTVNQENSGSTFKQWKKGINLAKGEYIWIAETDDWCEVSFLEELISAISNYNTISIAFCGTYLVSLDGDIVKEVKWAKPIEIFDSKFFLERYLSRTNSILNASMVIFKRDSFQKIDYDLSSLRYCGDWMSYVHMASFGGDILRVGKTLNYFRQPGEKLSWRLSNFWKSYLENVLVLKELYKMGILSFKNFEGLILERLILLENDNRVIKKDIKKIRFLMLKELRFIKRVKYQFFTRIKFRLFKK
jgi:glycosyltransferase involved in cell wall biosynthesis